jgi:membrane-associated phospholipid phosphatase
MAIATALLVLAVGASRILLAVHYVSDVVAGVALGAMLLVGSRPLRGGAALPRDQRG